MPNNNYSKVFHSGPYDGREIEDIVDLDPAYVLEASLDKRHYISQEAVNRARRLLDVDEEYDDFYVDEAVALGLTIYTDED